MSFTGQLNINVPKILGIKIMFKFILCQLVVFGCSANIANNLTVLIGTNSNYNAAWWKIILSLIIAVYFAGYSWNIKKKA
jgi:hypothetical protein